MAVESSTQLSLVPCRKRSRIEKDLDDLNLININELPEALLLEILYRLPCQWALQCKSVSKRWYSLISDPYFIRSFIHHRHCHKFGEFSEPFTLLLMRKDNIIHLPSDNSELSLDCGRDGFDFLNFLPCIKRARRNYRIEAAFNDLLLVCSEVSRDGFCEYYICNPFTKEWLMLPRPPYMSMGRTAAMVSFICEKYYSYDKDLQECITNVKYRYKVVCCITSELKMEIFSSETGEWSSLVVSSPREFGPIPHGVACNGMLHWVNDNKGLVVFDPFIENAELRYIDLPFEFTKHSFSIGEFQGRLRIFQFLREALFFSVWELEDYGNKGKWCMKHKVYLNQMISEHVMLVEIAEKSSRQIEFLAFHPKEGELVFLQFRNYVVLCNMRTMELKEAGQLHRSEILEQFLRARSGRFFLLHEPPVQSVFLLGQPSWPTPIAPLRLKFECPLDC
uniref:F-box domain-containing protein n=1 Tax=Fagus sylvatica TaxID=28930 RepID=A0A2N9FAG2_FAGSY